MVHESTVLHNGHVNGYHPAPAEAPPPKWRDQWPMFTHNCGWTDSDGKTHSLTIRTDDADELFGILKAIKHIVRQSKEKAAETVSQPLQERQVEAPVDTQHCAIHNVSMPRRWSKRTGGHYFAHKLPDGSFCYGRAKG